MKPAVVFGVVVAALMLLTTLRAVLGGSRPRNRHFKCARCGTLTSHNERTLEAWRNKRTKFFCQKCHAHWLASQPNQGCSGGDSVRAGGCLGIAVLFAVVPLVVAYIWGYA